MTVTVYSSAGLVGSTRGETALAVDGPWIVGTGDAAGLSERFPAAELVDLGQSVLCAGFNDSHQHLSITAEDLLHLDLSPAAVPSPGHLASALQRRAAELPAGSWVRGSRYDNTKMAPSDLVTRWDLDAACPDHPVLVVHIGGHWGIVNSAALVAAGITEDSKPPAGGEFGRDGTGALNGVLYERALLGLAYDGAGGSVIPPTSLEDRLRGLARAQEMFHAAGITSVTDAFVGASDLELLDAAHQRGLLTMRDNYLVGYEHYERLRDDGLLHRAEPGAKLRFHGVKAFVDGAIAGRTCLVEEPFEGSDDHGIQAMSAEELTTVVKMVHSAGDRIGVHANGDRAIRLLLDVYEAALGSDPRPDAGHRIEHCTIVDEDIVRRMARARVSAIPFGSYVHYHGDNLLDWYGPQRLERMFAHRWFLDAGVAVAGSSDYPCGPFEPLLGLQSLVTRASAAGAVLGGSQRISRDEALGLYTWRAAELHGESHVKGRLVEGQLADFVVLSEDPTSADPERLSDIEIRSTWVGGEKVWGTP